MNKFPSFDKSVVHEKKGSLSVGVIGENVACRYLQRKGMKLICRNWRCVLGEIDAVFFDDDELVFVEVKSRLVPRYSGSHIFDNIDYRKQRKLRSLVELYIAAHYRMLRPPPVRIDLVGVMLEQESLKPVSIEHLVAAL